MAELTKEEWAYTAGVIDADGCIQAPKGAGKLARNAHHRVEIHVVQKDVRLIDYLASSFGGSVNVVIRHHASGVRHYYRWMVTGIKAGTVLRGIIPYLVLKGAQARIGLELQALIRVRGASGCRRRLPQEVIERRAQLAASIKALNSPVETESTDPLMGDATVRAARMKNVQSQSETS